MRLDELSPTADRKLKQKQLHGKPHLNLSLTGDKLVCQALREQANLAAQIWHLIDFIR